MNSYIASEYSLVQVIKRACDYLDDLIEWSKLFKVDHYSGYTVKNTIETQN